MLLYAPNSQKRQSACPPAPQPRSPSRSVAGSAHRLSRKQGSVGPAQVAAATRGEQGTPSSASIGGGGDSKSDSNGGRGGGGDSEGGGGGGGGKGGGTAGGVGSGGEWRQSGC